MSHEIRLNMKKRRRRIKIKRNRKVRSTETENKQKTLFTLLNQMYLTYHKTRFHSASMAHVENKSRLKVNKAKITTSQYILNYKSKILAYQMNGTGNPPLHFYNAAETFLLTGSR